VIVWTRAKDESNPQRTAINVQISTTATLLVSQKQLIG